jgi:hypothetical protein
MMKNKMDKQRTPKKVSDSQAMRGALHLYLTQVANEANNKGLTLQDMVKVIKHLEIEPSLLLLKETFAKPYIEAAFKIKSTEKLTADQVTQTYKALDKVFSLGFDISFPFPSRETQMLAEVGSNKYQ